MFDLPRFELDGGGMVEKLFVVLISKERFGMYRRDEKEHAAKVWHCFKERGERE